jgi:hypothetical protein
MEKAHIGFWWESQKERIHKKCGHRWENYIEMDLSKII